MRRRIKAVGLFPKPGFLLQAEDRASDGALRRLAGQGHDMASKIPSHEPHLTVPGEHS